MSLKHAALNWTDELEDSAAPWPGFTQTTVKTSATHVSLIAMPLVWNPSPVIFSIGPLELRWYGFLFALGFYGGYRWMLKVYRLECKPLSHVSSLLTYMIVATLIGARLGHCLFYEPGYFLAHPLEILAVWHGGLASHGTVIGVLSAWFVFSLRHPSETFLWISDRCVIGGAFAGGMIRLGNMFNSEIIGKPTDLPWGVVFPSVDTQARHPAQLYEAIYCFCVFFLLRHLYLKKKGITPPGLILGLFFVLIFCFRVAIELVKENQVVFENAMPLNMGQLLSIPLILVGIILIVRAQKLSA